MSSAISVLQGLPPELGVLEGSQPITKYPACVLATPVPSAPRLCCSDRCCGAVLLLTLSHASVLFPRLQASRSSPSSCPSYLLLFTKLLSRELGFEGKFRASEVIT